MSVTQIAEKVVDECLQIRPDEQVLIFTWDHTPELASALALEVHKAGAVPLVLLEPNEVHWGYLLEVPEEYYGKPPRAFLAALGEIDASIWLRGPEDPSRYQKVSGARLAKVVELEKPVMDKVRERKIRSVNLLIGHVTPQRAETYGFNLEMWRKGMHNAMAVDYKKMSLFGGTVASKLQRGGKIRVTARNGTDLVFRVTDRPVHVNDGIIDEDDRSKGTIFENLPSGVVTVAPIETSANGIIIFDQPRALRGKLVKGLKFAFENGKLTSTEASDNMDAFAELYHGATGDKDRIGSFAIGINPEADFIGYPTDELVLGAVSVGVGSNREIGGDNDTIFGYSQTLRNPTIEINGTKLLIDGKFSL